MATPLIFIALALVPFLADKTGQPTAQVTITGELACLHCTFGEGDHCAVCLKLNDQMPVILEGKAAKQFEELRLSEKLLVAEGTLSINKQNRFVLTSNRAHLVIGNDKITAPSAGRALIRGEGCCWHCDLEKCDKCTAAVKNGKYPILLEGKDASHIDEKVKSVISASGKLLIDKRGSVHLHVETIDRIKK